MPLAITLKQLETLRIGEFIRVWVGRPHGLFVPVWVEAPGDMRITREVHGER